MPSRLPRLPTAEPVDRRVPAVFVVLTLALLAPGIVHALSPGDARGARPAAPRPGGRVVSRVLGLTLGILTALGGFVDIGEMVFATQAGARFGYELLWPVVIGAFAIIVYAEMCGRVAIVAGKP